MPLSNHYKHELMDGNIDYNSHAFKIMLMGTSFTFDIDAHAVWANVSASELASGYGYTTGGSSLVLEALSEDDVNDRAEVVFNNISWTASGGSIGPSAGAIIIDDTHASDCIVGYIDFSGSQTATDGGSFQVTNIKVRNA
jgi:hypothetical protein